MTSKPSEQIRTHIRGTGSGFELDDLLTRRTGGVYDQISTRISEIERRFRTPQYPVGTVNPASFQSLEELAMELEQQGL